MDLSTLQAEASPLSRAVRHLTQASTEVQVAMAKTLDLGITDASAMDLLLSAPGPMGPAELGTKLGIRTPSATTLVDRLEAAGHVERHPHPTDRRRQVITPTDHARAEMYRGLRPVVVLIDEAGERLDPHQREVVADFLNKLAEDLHRHAGASAAGGW